MRGPCHARTIRPRHMIASPRLGAARGTIFSHLILIFAESASACAECAVEPVNIPQIFKHGGRIFPAFFVYNDAAVV